MKSGARVRLHLLWVLATSCNLVPPDAGPAALTEQRLWLVMVWINADSGGDTHEWILADDLELLDSVQPDPSVHLVAQVSRCGQDPYDGGWNGTRRYLFDGPGADPVGLQARRLADPAEDVELSSGRSLVDFVRWASRRFPARHRMLVIQAHGSGWQGLSPARMESDPTDLITIADGELGRALQEASSVAPLDVLVLDACLMGMWETGWDARRGARYVVTSEEMGGPLLGSWHDLIPRLVAGPDEPRGVCASIPAMLEGERTRANAATRTCVDTRHHGTLSRAVDDLAKEALASEAGMDALEGAVQRALHFAKPAHRDLGDLARIIARDPRAPEPLGKAAMNVLGALERYVVDHASAEFTGVGTSHGVCGGDGSWGSCERSSGVAIWAPLDPPPPHMLEAYLDGPWCATSWDEVILAMGAKTAP